jgi:hypothetical protein
MTNNVSNVGFEVLASTVKKITVFWDITPRSPLKVNRRFGGTYRFHLQSRRMSRERNQHESRQLGLFFDPEGGGNMFFRNVCWLSTDYTVLHQCFKCLSWTTRYTITNNVSNNVVNRKQIYTLWHVPILGMISDFEKIYGLYSVWASFKGGAVTNNN